MLSYLERTEEKYNNFYSLILNEKVKMEEYPEYDQSDLEQLVENDCIQIDEEGYIEIKDIRK